MGVRVNTGLAIAGMLMQFPQDIERDDRNPMLSREEHARKLKMGRRLVEVFSLPDDNAILSQATDLIEQGADLECVDGEMNTPLLLAVEKGLPDIVQRLINRKAEVNSDNRDKHQTPLHIAAKYGYTKIVSMLLEAGAEINAQDGLEGNTALHLAAQCNSSKTVEVLISEYANVYIKNCCGRTALDEAVYWCDMESSEIVNMLMGKKISLVECCRQTIGLSLCNSISSGGMSNSNAVNQLPLPEIVKKYIEKYF